MQHRSTAGARAWMLKAASGLFIRVFASQSGNTNITVEQTAPRTKNVHHATRYVRRACICSPRVCAALIMRESATGKPAVASVRNRL